MPLLTARRSSRLLRDARQDDFLLICHNCKKYNSPSTIFYKAADKLQRFGERIFQRDAAKLATLQSIRDGGGGAVDVGGDEEIDVVSGGRPAPLSGTSRQKRPTVVLVADGPLGAYRSTQWSDDGSSGSSKRLKLPGAVRDGAAQPKKKVLYKKTLDGSFLFSSSRASRTMYPDGSLIGTCTRRG